MEKAGHLLARLDAPSEGRFVAPHILFRARGIEDMQREIFGPILHVATFKAERLEQVISAINIRVMVLLSDCTRGSKRVCSVLSTEFTLATSTLIATRLALARCAAVRRRRAVRYRSECQRSPLPAPFPQSGRFSRSRPALGERASLKTLQDHLRKLALKIGQRVPTASPSCASICAARHPAAIAAAASVDFGPVDLPGPTGRANTLTLHPRGTALCLGPDLETLLAQAVQALAAGCGSLQSPQARPMLTALTAKDLPIAVIDGSFDPASAEEIDLNVAAFSGDAPYPCACCASRSLRAAARSCH